MNAILRNQPSKEQIRQSIIQAALKLFLEEGFEHVSMRKIADVIQYTPTTIYNYFQNKEELLQELFKMGFAQFNRLMRTTFYETFDKSGEQRLSALLRAYIDFSLDEPHYFHLIFHKNLHRVMACMETSPEMMDKDEHEGMFLLIQVVKAVLPVHQQDYQLATERAFFIWSAVNGYAIMLPSLSRGATRDQLLQVAERFIDSLLYGFLTRKE